MAGPNSMAMAFSMAEDKTIMDYVENRRYIDFIGRIGINCFRGDAVPTVYVEAIVDGDEIIRDEPEEPQIEEEVK
jgi:hypothetical protein